ncbi:MAG: 2-keto-3-deoxygluconate permease [Selenomonadales bacterium]|jgi:2-keto-3-deoxygluconate permease|nr:2-keto-3-deoxygluconate permease [Selenomonadales bacterium]
MPILSTVRKIPGGLMVVPLFLGILVNTFVPSVIDIGGFTTGLWRTGVPAILGLFLFCNGAQINVKQAGQPLSRGVILTIVKFAIGALLGILIDAVWGPWGILGITPLAIIAALTNSNGGLYAALSSQYGDPNDVGAVSVLSINDGPFLTMVALGAAGMANIPIMALLAVILPIVVGCVLGNLDENIRTFLEPGTKMTIPFFAFPLGAALNLSQLVQAGGPGIILGLLCVVLTGFGGYYALKLIRHPSPAVGAAIGTTAGNAVGTPMALAAADPALAELATSATVQIAAAIIVTAILCPLLVNFLDKRDKVNTRPMVTAD